MELNKLPSSGYCWTCRVYWFDDGRKRPQREYYFQTKQEAKAKEEELKAEKPSIVTEVIFYEIRNYG